MSKSDDPRLDYLINREVENPTAKVALIGYPCDEGVVRNGGRPGSSGGPDVFRRYLPKVGSVCNPEYGFLDLSKIEVKDFGDAGIGTTLEETHLNLKAKVKEALDQDYIPFIVGGGNDQSYPNARALIEHLDSGDMAVINVDAHLDVRPLLNDGTSAHSGSPFRQLLEDQDFHRIFVEFACQGSVCGAEHARFVTNHGGRMIWLGSLRRSGTVVVDRFLAELSQFGARPTFVSFDIDSIKSADCPGVSAPAVDGLSAGEALAICQESGKHPHVRLFDLSEFNPLVEEDRTARLVVHMFYSFLLGLAQRQRD